ncbi:unnamed protein product [Albugo candida]|nr:unnamed protein product [Albugo candida]|eukprot:CCI46321.1 unnamed protein product [Albugo candida]
MGGSAVTDSMSGTDSSASMCPTLSKTQRLVGFAVCFVAGYIISFGSTFALLVGNTSGATFGITYSVGNVLALCGSGFLAGPKQQLKLMMKPVRRVAAAMYVGMIVVVLVVACAAPNLGGLVLFLVLIQFLTAIWYTATYIPFGQRVIKRVLGNVCGVSDAF